MAQNTSTIRFLFAFAAGFLAVLLFHQPLLGLLHAIALSPRAPYPIQPTAPFGVPQIWSLAFWGGIWGIVFAALAPRFAQGNRYWLAALIFGAYCANPGRLVCRSTAQGSANCGRGSARSTPDRLANQRGLGHGNSPVAARASEASWQPSQQHFIHLSRFHRLDKQLQLLDRRAPHLEDRQQ
ncbi:hypothetical protein [Leptolyngbya sp. FACHB-261]|uniref:hypothetical protein n=1 Tax=Leptolyngbya sp. FACHB-261 TaxID=2692806 RepID=UPI0018EFB2B9|nr:hypothetical protein [Leptolyngbya sp. FACHB-261]